jgi:hypothetical protein
MEKGQIASGKLYFTIDFEWLTEHIRNLWSEGRFELALKTANSTGLPLEVQYDVIRGNKAFRQDPEGKKGCSGIVIEDTWQPVLDECNFCMYPDPVDLPRIAAESLKKQFEYQDRLKFIDEEFEKENISEDEDEEPVSSSVSGLKFPVIDTEDTSIESLMTQINVAMLKGEKDKIPELRRMFELRKLLPKGAPLSVNDYMKRQKEFDARPLPKATSDFSGIWGGWLGPNGDYFAAEGYMEHVWLIGVVANLTEEEAERAGWIKIQRLSDEFTDIRSLKDPTARQLDTLSKWAGGSKLRLADMSKYLKGLESTDLY